MRFCNALFSSFDFALASALLPAAGSDLARLNVIAALTFFVQPLFLVKFLLMFFYVGVAVEGLKVFARARAWEWAMGKNVLDVSGARLPIDRATLGNYLACVILPPVVYTLLAWLLSGFGPGNLRPGGVLIPKEH